MKKIFLSILLLATSTHCFAQSTDTSGNISKAYKNNIQGGIFAPAGLFAFQFEHALTKKISFNTIAEFDYRYYSKDKPIDNSIELMPQLRWYTQKKKATIRVCIFLFLQMLFIANPIPMAHTIPRPEIYD